METLLLIKGNKRKQEKVPFPALLLVSIKESEVSSTTNLELCGEKRESCPATPSLQQMESKSEINKQLVNFLK